MKDQLGLMLRAATAMACVALAAGCDPDNAKAPTGALHAPGSASAPETVASVSASIPDHTVLALDAAQASKFVQLSLHCAAREYPNKPGSVLEGDDTVVPPRDRTPSFYGCFDWHSAVHGHWAMVRALRRFPKLDEGKQIRELLDAHLTEAPLAKELAFFKTTRNRTYERPYGWGWLLRLAAELHGWDDADARRWSKQLAPLATFIAGQMADYLPRLSRPIREGTHANTAFAMVHALDYAREVGDGGVERVLVQRARDFYLGDVSCPTDYEPSGEDFISPCLVEADLMRRVLPQAEFVAWLDRFLPPATSPRFRPLLTPVEVKDRHDPKIGHLIGLALQRAWCFEGIAASLPEGDERRVLFGKLARLHRHEAVGQMFDSGYGGEHWLASFAIYLLT